METELIGVVESLGHLVAQYALNVVGALVLLVVGWTAAAWAQRYVRNTLERAEGVDATLRPLVASLVRYTIIVLVLIAVLARFGVQTTSIIAVLGTAGLAIGLALQGSLSNVAAGALLLFLRPIRVGEYIEAGSTAGTVMEIGLFATELHTFDGVYVSVPNAQLTATAIKNYSRLPTRRLDLVIGIDYEDDVDKALGVLNDLLAQDERVLREPAHEVMVRELAESSVNLNMRCWTPRENYWALLFDLTKQAKARLDAEGITIPFPQRVLRHIGAGSPHNEAA